MKKINHTDARCEVCNNKLSQCGELNLDGEPTLDCKVCQLNTEIERLKNIKIPIGDDSPNQQARAWEKVYSELVKQGLHSFIPTPIMCGSAERAVQYIKHLSSQINELNETLS